MSHLLPGRAAPPVAVLVEGESDAVVVASLARSRGLSGARHGTPAVEIVAMHGVTNVRSHLTRLRRDRPSGPLLGLYDDAEERFVAGAWRDLGVTVATRGELAELGFFACVADLEEELIRALGAARVEDAVAELGELARFRVFQRQPEWRDRPLSDQLHRFAGTGAGRKIALAERLAHHIDDTSTPQPLARLLDRAAALVDG